MSKRRLAMAALFAAPCFALTAQANAEVRASYSAGIEYSSGDYGDVRDTEVTSIPLSARFASGDWAFRVSIPYLSISGPAEVSDSTDGDGSGSDGTFVRTGVENGFGDTSLAVTRTFRRIAGRRSYLDITGRVRVPTGDDERGLGVGATDYSIGAELGGTGDHGGAYLSTAYRILGDRDDFERVNGWQASVGGWLRTGGQTRIGASYSWREASTASGTDPSEIGGYFSFPLGDTLRASLSAAAGLSDASADYSTGLRFTWRPDPQRNR